MGFRLNHSTLADVRSAYGQADEFEIPESHHGFGICYRAQDSDQIVVFLSAREFGGPEKTLLGVAVHAVNPLGFPCSASSIAESDLKIGDVSLFIDKSAFTALFEGEPSTSDFGHLFYNFDSRRPLTTSEEEHFKAEFGEGHGITGVDSSLGVWWLIKDQRVIQFGVWLEETY